LTLHPELVVGPLSGSIIGRAQHAGLVQVEVRNIRDFATDRHKTVDDAPFGGGAGMVMRVDVVASALAASRSASCRVLLTSPSGATFRQADAVRYANEGHLVVVCGHYEGIDARIEGLVDEVVSLGDFVLTGGEIPACAIVDATARLLPGVVGNEASTQDESFQDGLLEYPQYTRPRVWEGQEVPEVLLSGHHARVLAWRQEQALARTRVRRPDLYAAWLARNVDGGGPKR
jgi:tRNA (guanine37-N1)-methyltransferase